MNSDEAAKRWSDMLRQQDKEYFEELKRKLNYNEIYQ